MPKAGLEPARLAAPPPQDGVSANSTTSAKCSRADGQPTADRDYITSFPALLAPEVLPALPVQPDLKAQSAVAAKAPVVDLAAPWHLHE